MNGQFVVTFDPAEGAVLRMLGLVERRGFRLRGVAMTEEDSAASITIDVEARDPARRLDVVARQLGRLVDVHSVHFSTAEAGSIA